MNEKNTSDLPMDEHTLTTPVSSDALAKLKIGDIVYIDGTVFTGRIGVYKIGPMTGHEFCVRIIIRRAVWSVPGNAS